MINGSPPASDQCYGAPSTCEVQVPDARYYAQGGRTIHGDDAKVFPYRRYIGPRCLPCSDLSYAVAIALVRVDAASV
jgi:hypothetical protein